MNRMDDWIEARLMNAKRNKSAVSTKDLIAEIGLIFKLNTSPRSIRNLREKIKTIRNRVNKKCARQKQTCRKICPEIVRAECDDTAMGGERAVPHTKPQKDRKNNEGHRGEGLFQGGAK